MKRASHIEISEQDFREAIVCAAKGHYKRDEVRKAMSDLDGETRRFYTAYLNGTWRQMLAYRKLTKTNNNGKVRKIDSPSWETRVLQWAAINKLRPIYDSKDNHNGLNCKEGCGITAREKRKSVVHRMKHIYYDRLDLHYAVIADQRKCYEHITAKTLRRALRKIVDDKAFVDFMVEVTMVNGHLPIGTPTSPLAHHIVMLDFDIFIREAAPESVRYADDNAVFVHTKEEAQQLKWRIKNWWWYDLGIRAKRHTLRVVPMTEPLDFCGYIFHRGGGGHSKGYVGLRNSTLKKARRATERNWGSYFGIMIHADLFGEMKRIERTMKLSQLTNIITLTRPLDAPNIPIKEIIGQPFNIVDYELRRDKEGNPNWVKLLVGIAEPDGRVRAGEIHGCFQWLVQFLWEAEQQFGKEQILPIEDAVIENQCGYIFADSTNQIKYFEQ